MTELRLDAKALSDTARALRSGEPVLAREFTRALREAGNIVARLAKQKASFSSHIPGSIRTVVSSQRVAVRAGPVAFPHAGEAAALENRGVAGTVRHPVYGHREVWAATRAHPFLTPAGEESLPAAEAEVVKAVDVFTALIGRGA
jgi:hypothetical protein